MNQMYGLYMLEHMQIHVYHPFDNLYSKELNFFLKFDKNKRNSTIVLYNAYREVSFDWKSVQARWCT